jgi:hypothetical protein
MKPYREKLQTYRLDFYKSVPVSGGGWNGRRGIKTIKGYGLVDAGRKLYKALSKPYSDAIKVEIDGGIILGSEGFIPLNPDSLPVVNANLMAQYQLALKGGA